MLFQEEAGGREDIFVIVDDQYLAESLFHRGDRFSINSLVGGGGRRVRLRTWSVSKPDTHLLNNREIRHDFQ
jgi:hypothetical protein